jgi:hypothetical protein
MVYLDSVVDGCVSNSTAKLEHNFMVDALTAIICVLSHACDYRIGLRMINDDEGKGLIYSNKVIKKMILVGVSALCWANWRCRNGIIFNKTKHTSFLQSLFREPIRCALGRNYSMTTT